MIIEYPNRIFDFDVFATIMILKQPYYNGLIYDNFYMYIKVDEEENILDIDYRINN